MLTYADSQSKALEKALETLESSNAQSASEIAAVEKKAKDKAISALLQASCVCLRKSMCVTLLQAAAYASLRAGVSYALKYLKPALTAARLELQQQLEP
jgi:hypothetical protein